MNANHGRPTEQHTLTSKIDRRPRHHRQIIGIVGILLSAIPFLGIILGIAAVIFSVIGLKRTKDGTKGGKGMAITGIILGGLTIIVGIIVLISVFAFVGALKSEGVLTAS